MGQSLCTEGKKFILSGINWFCTESICLSGWIRNIHIGLWPNTCRGNKIPISLSCTEANTSTFISDSDNEAHPHHVICGCMGVFFFIHIYFINYIFRVFLVVKIFPWSSLGCGQYFESVQLKKIAPHLRPPPRATPPKHMTARCLTTQTVPTNYFF